MDKNTYYKYKMAFDKNDIDAMRKLYLSNKFDEKVKFAYAKMLIGNWDLDEGEKLLKELISTVRKHAVYYELAKLEILKQNFESAKKYLDTIIYSSKKTNKYKFYAYLLYAKIEQGESNTQSARNYYKKVMLNNKYLVLQQLALIGMGKLEYSLGNTDLAYNYFNNALNQSSNIKIKEYIYELKINMKIQERDYISALKLIKVGINENVDISHKLLIFISKKLNIFIKKYDYNNCSYSYSYTIDQIINYDEIDAIEHIIDRHINSKYNGKSIFNNNIDIYKLFKNIKENLNEENRKAELDFQDIYIIKYENVGINGENYLKVITLPDSKEIITMYPIRTKNNIYLKEDVKEKIYKI